MPMLVRLQTSNRSSRVSLPFFVCQVNDHLQLSPISCLSCLSFSFFFFSESSLFDLLDFWCSDSLLGVYPVLPRVFFRVHSHRIVSAESLASDLLLDVCMNLRPFFAFDVVGSRFLSFLLLSPTDADHPFQRPTLNSFDLARLF